jgi:hypothetical protein
MVSPPLPSFAGPSRRAQLSRSPPFLVAVRRLIERIHSQLFEDRVSNRKIATALNVHHSTVDDDVAEIRQSEGENASEANDAENENGGNPPPEPPKRVSNRKIATALNVRHTTIDRDVAQMCQPDGENASESGDAEDEGGTNVPPRRPRDLKIAGAAFAAPADENASEISDAEGDNAANAAPAPPHRPRGLSGAEAGKEPLT